MAFGSSIRFAQSFIEVGLDATMATRSLRKFRNQMRSFRRVTAGVGAGVTAALTPVVAILTKATIEAAKFQEQVSKFNVVFGRLAPDVRAFREQMVKGLGQSRSEMTRFLAEFQDLLVPMGAAPQDAAALSQQLTKLAVDLGSFNNRNTAMVFEDLTSALTGSSETMKKYGVIANEAAVKQELLNQKLDPKRATEFQKAVARINIIMRSTTAAQGDAARTAGSLVNQYRAAQNEIQNNLVEMGQELLPTVTLALKEIVALMKDWKDVFSDLAMTSGQIAKQLRGAGGGFTSLEAQANRGIAARQTYGILGRAYQLAEGAMTGSVGLALMSDQQLRRTAGSLASRRINAEPANRLPAVPDINPAGIGGGGTSGALAAIARLGEGAGFRARSFVRGMTRQFGPAIVDARRAAMEQLKGMRTVRDAQKRLPISSHETFATAAFGGDFVRRANTTEETQKQLLDVQTEMLAFIKANRVVFG